MKCGATRSGKTYLDYFLIPRRIRACGEKGLIVLLGNTQGTLTRNLLEPMRTLYGGEMVGEVTPQNTARLFGRKCYVLGADRVSQAAKIQGSGIQYCYGDEVTTWSEEVFAMLKSRLSEANSCFDGTCNPDGPNHWFKRFLDSGADLFLQQYTIDDNPFLPPAFVKSLKQEYSGTVYYDRYIRGCWKAAEGSVYRMFADQEARFLGSAPIELASVGVDFGGNRSATAFVCVGLTRNLEKLCVLDEFYTKETLSPSALEREFVAFVGRCAARWPLYDAYCDSAESVLIEGLRMAAMQAGLAVNVRNARKGRITERIRFVCAMMAQERFLVAPQCRAVRDALCGAVWESGGAEDRRRDDGFSNIDSLDAMEYAAEPYMRDMLQMRMG